MWFISVSANLLWNLSGRRGLGQVSLQLPQVQVWQVMAHAVGLVLLNLIVCLLLPPVDSDLRG